jgi:signal transduction histidine kinase
MDMYDLSMGGAPRISLAGDVELLQVIYRNLFSNALKYGLPTGKIAYGVEDHGDFYQFNVWNEGTGIPPEEREMVFENFVRLEHSGGQPGTGLGLYITRRIVEAMGGRIWVESQPGKWTNFIFRLPKKGIFSGEKEFLSQ